MKNTMKLFLVICLFCGSAFANGDMGAGGFGDMGAGGRTCTENCPPPPPGGFVNQNGDADDTILSFVRSFLRSIF